MAEHPALRRLTLVASLVVLALALGACGDDGSDAAPDDPPGSSTTTEATGPAPTDAVATEAFCAEMERLDVETPESYVGSEEHVADVEALADVAPAEVRPAVERYRDFLASGAITDDPRSNETDRWPPAVQADIAEIQDFRTTAC
jgi:hypothetical protein